MSVVSLRGIRRAFGEVPVLDGLDLEVGEAETVALLGPSGSGKSTILRIVAGLDRPDAGSVELHGAEATAVGPERRDVGYVFQDLALFPHLDVAANVGFGPRMRGWSAEARRARVAEALELVGLGGAGRRDPSSLSGGERQRVALARALAPRPRLLLLDEPFGALDRTLRDRLLLELRDLFAELGLAVLAVTHDPDEASALADRLAVLLGGAIAQAGTPGEVIGEPSDVAVARLMGHTNIVPVRRTGETFHLPWGTQVTPPPGRRGIGHVLVRPGAVHRADDGPVEAEVVGTVLRGGAPVVRLRLGGVDLEATGWDPIPPTGAVRVRVDPAGCLALT